MVPKVASHRHHRNIRRYKERPTKNLHLFCCKEIKSTIIILSSSSSLYGLVKTLFLHDLFCSYLVRLVSEWLRQNTRFVVDLVLASDWNDLPFSVFACVRSDCYYLWLKVAYLNVDDLRSYIRINITLFI